MLSARNTIDLAAAPDPQSLIREERANKKFSPDAMHNFLESSKENSELFKVFIQQMERDPILSNDASYFEQTKTQQREITARKIARVAQYLEKGFSVSHEAMFNSLLNLVDPQVGTRIGVNLGLFLGCIRGNGTESQRNYWTITKETKHLKTLYGCFGMTELAHGSNVAGLETTATFDKETDEFVINTPHIGATKWWIGGAAHSATHCSVYARLIVNGKDYGVKTFIVPLRDNRHVLMPGITVGDIGAKMGRDGIDNGWIQFSHVRIPRFFMLQKFCKVSKDGKVVMPPMEQLSYTALLGGRVSMVMDSYRTSARFATIALRYALGRRQFKSASQGDGTETQLLNYPLHQRRLLPYLAQAYVFSAGAWKMDKSLGDVLDALDKGVSNNDMASIGKSVEKLKSVFLDSAASKSTATWLTAECIDQCRQSCGGHGYSSYNAFGKAYNDWVVQCTWEGDNSVLAMSVGKPVIKAVAAVLENDEEQSGSFAFLNGAKQYNSKDHILKNPEDALDVKKVLHAVEVLMTRIAIEGNKVVKENNDNFDSVGAASLAISRLKAHHYLFGEFVERVDSTDEKEVVPYLKKIAQLYAVANIIDKSSGDFLAHNILSPELLNDIVNKIVPKVCQDIRPDVIAFTDSFQLSDFALNSQIGKYDGNIYENYFTTVKTLNPPAQTKAPYSVEFETGLNRGTIEERSRYESSNDARDILSK